MRTMGTVIYTSDTRSAKGKGCEGANRMTDALTLATRAGAEAGRRATENAQRYRYLATGARSYVNGQWIVFAREHPDSAPYRSEFMKAAGYLA